MLIGLILTIGIYILRYYLSYKAFFFEPIIVGLTVSCLVHNIAYIYSALEMKKLKFI